MSSKTQQKCSICQEVGHNRRTCPHSTGAPKHKHSHPTKKSIPKTQKKKKTSISLTKESLGNNFFKSELERFKETREAQYDTALNIHSLLESGKNVAVKAEEKSGKREIMECVHCLLNLQSNMSPHSVYITALDRKDTKVQFEEQEKFGITSLVARDWGSLLSEIVKLLDSYTNSKIFIHMDEDDYGTGDKQNMSKIYSYDGVGKDRVMFIGYSATPEELEKSEGFDTDWVKVQFTPAPSYFGAKKYLENGLVREPYTFFDGDDFTEHGFEIIEEIRKNCNDAEQVIQQRNVVVVRDVTPRNLSILTNRKCEFEKKYECEVHVYDMHSEMKWGDKDSWKNMGKKSNEDEDGNHVSYTFKPVVVFISQTCTRSTEICPLGHRRLYAWHDVRKLLKSEIGDKVSNYNTLSQAIGRVKHYTQPGKPENNILLYCDRSILEFTLNPKSVIGKIKVSARIKTIVNKQAKKIVEFDDRYDCASDVPDSGWQNGNPNEQRDDLKFYEIDGKWCHYDKKVRYFGDNNMPGGGGHANFYNVLQYESPSSDRYYIRKAIFIDNPSYGEKDTHTFVTTTKSMYQN